MLKIINPKYFIYGLLIGAAGTMPGLSGGTIAFVLGIYQRMINAIASLKPLAVLRLLKIRAWQSLLVDLDLAFLSLLIIGKVMGIFLFSLFIPYLVQTYPNHMNALFFGLMAASIPHIFSSYGKNPSVHHWLIIALVTVLTTYLSGMKSGIVVNNFGFQFLSGAFAIVAMLLPGISGSFVLVLLGNYHYIFTQINHLFFLDINAAINLIPFGLGAIAGVIIFISVIRYCFSYFNGATLAVLTGLMIGSLPALWPFTNAEQGRILLPSYFGFNELLILLLFAAGIGITTVSLKVIDK
jgi:putative membrane protein